MKRAQMLVLSDAMTSENILFFDVFMSTMKQYFGDVAFYVEEHDDYQVMNEDVPSVEYFETLVQNYITTNEAEAILKDKELKRLAKHVINSKIKRKADFELKAMDERKKLSKQMRDVEDEEDDEMLLRFRTKGGHIHRIKIAIESVPAFMRHVTRELDRFKVSHMLIMEIPFENIAALHVQHILFNSKLEKRPRGLLVLDLKKKPVFKSRRISCDARNMSQEKIRTDFTKDKQASQYSRQTFVKLKDFYGNASSVPKFQKVEKPLTRKMLGVLKKNGLAEKQKYPEQELEPNTVLMDGHIIKNCHPCFLDVIRSWDSKKMEHLLSQPVNASNYIVPIEDNCTVAEFLKNQQNYCGRRKFTFPCCGQCVDWHYWHCYNCNRCSYGQTIPRCEHCGFSVRSSEKPLAQPFGVLGSGFTDPEDEKEERERNYDSDKDEYEFKDQHLARSYSLHHTYEQVTESK
nr:unnamed protein product [Naegleria fowleri]